MNGQPSSAARSCSCKNYLPLLRRRQIRWFLSRISIYIEKGCTPSAAIDFAIDDCLMEGIFYSLFIRRRAEIKELLLQQFRPFFTCIFWYTLPGTRELMSLRDGAGLCPIKYTPANKTCSHSPLDIF